MPCPAHVAEERLYRKPLPPCDFRHRHLPRAREEAASTAGVADEMAEKKLPNRERTQ